MKITTTALFLTVATLILSACEVTRGGSGTTTSGEPVVAEVRQNSSLQQSFTITSVVGWQCTGVLTSQQRNNAVASVIEVPLTCNNGVTGTSLVSVDRWKGTADINFRLSNGTIGSATIG